MEKKPKKKVEKLVLRKETLLLLEEGALKEVAGAPQHHVRHRVLLQLALIVLGSKRQLLGAAAPPTPDF